MKGRPPSDLIPQNVHLRLCNGRLQDVRSLRPLRTLHNFELDIFSLFQGLKSLPLQCGIMYEDIIPALKANEPKSFAIVEPFDRTFSLHKTLLSSTATLSYVAGLGTQRATHLMKSKRQEEEQVGMTGSFEKQHRSRNPSRLQLAQHLPWRFKSCQAILCPHARRREVDKPRSLTYSVAPG